MISRQNTGPQDGLGVCLATLAGWQGYALGAGHRTATRPGCLHLGRAGERRLGWRRRGGAGLWRRDDGSNGWRVPPVGSSARASQSGSCSRAPTCARCAPHWLGTCDSDRAAGLRCRTKCRKMQKMAENAEKKMHAKKKKQTETFWQNITGFFLKIKYPSCSSTSQSRSCTVSCLWGVIPPLGLQATAAIQVAGANR